MTEAAAEPVLAISGLGFGWPGSAPLLSIERFELMPRERCFLFGPSGSGKSTLLNLIGGTLRAGSGSIRIAGREMVGARESVRDRLRADHVGFVFQMFNLVPYLDVIENVTLPCRFSPRRRVRALVRDASLDAAARRLLAHLGLGDPTLIARPVTELSVGQQQRVAAARALIGAPELVLADEPTSALDHDARESFLKLLFAECEALQSALLFVSHDHSLRPLFERSESLTALNRALPVAA
jgi:putative ABC transport system ATP-binding protein